jgi:hypothetical protein
MDPCGAPRSHGSPLCFLGELPGLGHLPRQFRAIGSLGTELAMIGFRTAQLNQAYLGKPFGFCSNLLQFAPSPQTATASLMIILLAFPH